MTKIKLKAFLFKLIAWYIVSILLFLLKYAHQNDYSGFTDDILPAAIKSGVIMGTGMAIGLEAWKVFYTFFNKEKQNKKNGE